jgi:hypothetical protein
MPKTPARSNAPPADDPIQEIVLARESGTHGDVLAAIGLAELLADVTGDRRVRVKSRGARFAVILSRPRRPSGLVVTTPAPGYEYLQSRSNVALPKEVLPAQAVDYQTVRDTIKALREQETELHRNIAATQDEAQRQIFREQLHELRQQWPRPPSEWRRYPPYLVLGAHDTANKLLQQIVRLPEDEVRNTVQAAIAALARQGPSGVGWRVKTVQLFTPNLAKGYGRLKPDSTERNDPTKAAWADPFLEWLRYRGYFAATVPVFHGSKGEHIRILAPIPGDITVAAYRSLVRELPTPRGGSPAKIDSLATLDIARLLIRRSDMAPTVTIEDDDDLVSIQGRAPSDVISGLSVTNYQSLGSARAVSAVSELAVPGWFPIENPADAGLWLEILDEHYAIVRALDDSHSDELTLLLGYRRFLEQRGDEHGSEPALDALLDFAGAYGSFVIRARETGRRVRQFNADLFRRVVESMSSTYGSILSDPGFQAVAAAVRRSTVSAQSRKARREEYREIRYGLLPDLRRASQLDDKNALMIAVSEFIDVYNAENARREEATGRGWHARVTVDQFAAFARLVDDADGAGVIGALLCAYGTCRESREPSAGEPDPATGSDEAPTGDTISESDDTTSEDQD